MDAFADDDVAVRRLPGARKMPDGDDIARMQRDFLAEIQRIGGHDAGVSVQKAGSGIGAGDIAVLEADIAVVLQVKRVDCRDGGCHVGGDIRFPPAALHEPVDAGGGKAAYGDDRDGSEGAQGDAASGLHSCRTCLFRVGWIASVVDDGVPDGRDFESDRLMHDVLSCVVMFS